MKMKKIILLVLAVITILSLVACGEQEKPVKPSGETVVSGEVTPEKDEPVAVSNEDIYKEVMEQYRDAFATYDLEDVDGEEEFFNNHPLVNPSLMIS
jgi:hypothetical protein